VEAAKTLSEIRSSTQARWEVTKERLLNVV